MRKNPRESVPLTDKLLHNKPYLDPWGNKFVLPAREEIPEQ